MFKRVVRMLCLGIMCIFILGLGGYTVTSFKSEVHLKDPQGVLTPFINSLPDLPGEEEILSQLPEYEQETDSPLTASDSDSPDFSEDPGMPEAEGPFGQGNFESDPENTNLESDDQTAEEDTTEEENPYVDDNGNLTKADLPEKIGITYTRSIKITLDDKEVELTSSNTIEFVRWFVNNWTSKAKLTYEVEEPPAEETDSTTATSNVKYTEELQSEENLTNMVASIPVIKKLPKYNDYDRTVFEKPTESYTLNGKRLNRNDYAWQTSKWFNKDDFTYMCPYTGTVIKDLDDKKQDKDFGNLDFDHIVPLKSAYLRGAKDWTPEQQNAYAYDQFVGVDVLNTANRSKSDKGPCEYLPDVNIEDYCYSWLMICSKYQLSMTQEEIDVCVDNINIALENGETVEFLGNIN